MRKERSRAHEERQANRGGAAPQAHGHVNTWPRDQIHCRETGVMHLWTRHTHTHIEGLSHDPKVFVKGAFGRKSDARKPSVPTFVV